MLDAYPAQKSSRNAWVTSLRGAGNPVDPFVPYAFLSEEEPDAAGQLARVSTVFLTNRECPWKCVMCDLWRNTLPGSVPAGAIPAQIDHALERLPPATHIKLYNSGSFFDSRAIPPEDYPAIADRVAGFDRVIVECHPALITKACLDFQRLLRGKLEIAIGLETAHPEALDQLNKGMTLAQFAAAANFLRDHDMDLRVFLLVNPPFIDRDEASAWVRRSIDFAFEHHAAVVSLIATRGGNGAMEALVQSGQFTPPTLDDLERAVEYGISLSRGRTFADLWDLERLSKCLRCFDRRRERLDEMNRRQMVLPKIGCACAGPSSP
jgi:radical SAM enzyme (TIGR01210 family)